MRASTICFFSLGLIAMSSGCASDAPIPQYQRFVLVPDTTKIGDHIPPALSLWIQRPDSYAIPWVDRTRRDFQQCICALNCTDSTRTQNE
jgi:hypothetical protein